jgi:polar amino acid transport system substrate-binding protein
MTIKKATNLILTKLKTSKNIWEILLYHKIALLESESRRIKLKKESITDPLTKLYNRRMVDTRLNELINEYNRDWTEFSILLLDIDFFKNINDTFWHDMWDQVLIWISNILKNELRTSDIIARWWGEEFLVILKRSKHKIALKKAENLKKIIKSTLIKYLINSDNKWKFCLHTDKCSNEKECQNQNAMCFPKEITCSIWVATIKNINWESESKNHIIKRADSALYIAKENWRNKVCSWN